MNMPGKGLRKNLEPVSIYFREIELLSFSLPEIRVRLVCSKGTYIRSFASDIGTALEQRRIFVCSGKNCNRSYHVDQAYEIEKFQEYVEQLSNEYFI